MITSREVYYSTHTLDKSAMQIQSLLLTETKIIFESRVPYLLTLGMVMLNTV